MGTFSLVLVFVVLVAGLPLVLELRLKSRHPEAYRELVAGLIADDVKPKRFRSEFLWRFLTQRRHKSLNDPLLSILSDATLAGLAIFLMVLVTAGIWFLVHGIRQGL